MSDISELLTVRMSAGELFERVRDEFPEELQLNLRDRLKQQFPEGVMIRLVFTLPTIH